MGVSGGARRWRGVRGGSPRMHKDGNFALYFGSFSGAPHLHGVFAAAEDTTPARAPPDLFRWAANSVQFEWAEGGGSGSCAARRGLHTPRHFAARSASVNRPASAGRDRRSPVPPGAPGRLPDGQVGSPVSSETCAALAARAWKCALLSSDRWQAFTKPATAGFRPRLQRRARREAAEAEEGASRRQRAVRGRGRGR